MVGVRVNFFNEGRKVEISATSGIVRVAIDPRPRLVLLWLEAFLIVILDGAFFRMWAGLAVVYRALFLWGTASAVVAWFYQLSGSEVVEFDSQRLTLRKNILGWDLTREYSIAECSRLEWRELTEDDRRALQFKVGWRTIRFGEYLSEEQAIEVLALLQKELPDAAQKLCVDLRPGKSHFQTLGLR
jgi:hypothetical protein